MQTNMFGLLSINSWFMARWLFIVIPIFHCYSQELSVKGTVYDIETKSVIPYVNIMFKGKPLGTSSDVNGNYELRVTKENIDSHQQILFSSLGYDDRLILLDSLLLMKSISMNQSSIMLQEVVLVDFEKGKRISLPLWTKEKRLKMLYLFQSPKEPSLQQFSAI